MKLIDRDKFISDMFDFYIENRWNPRDIHFSLLDVRSNIDSPEFEVEAIPVDWIKRYASKKSYNDGMDCYWHFWEEDVLEMVADWEKENE